MLRAVLILLFLSSCSLAKDALRFTDSNTSESFEPVGEKKIAALKSRQVVKQAPLSIDVAQAFFDQDKLNVKVIITTHTEISPDQIVLGIAGLRDGELVEETYKKISDVVASERLDAETKLAVRFELASKDLSEYQVKCNWGNDATELWAKLNPSIETPANESRASLANQKIDQNLLKTPAISGKLELSDLDIQSEELPCVLAPCDLNYTVVGRFLNGKETQVSTAKLAVGLYWAEEGQLPELPKTSEALSENEQVIEVALGLQSGEAATIRVKLDRSIPQVPGGSFIPHVRLISAE